MPNGTCGVISFGLKGGRQAASVFMDKLKLCSIETHVLIPGQLFFIRPAIPTASSRMNSWWRQVWTPSMIRFSVGLESADDVIEDIRQALED